MSFNVNNISKNYATQTAVASLSFSINKGEVVGFLGPNGAGKSTTLKMIAGYLQPDQGEVTLNGISLQKNPIAFKKLIGYLPESNALYEDMYVKEYFNFLSEIHQLKAPTKRINELIEQTGLSKMYHKKIGDLSKGYKQRVGIAAAIIHEPALVLLDEPTSGLDPNQLIEIRQLIKSLSAGAMILFSTHILQEVSAICSRVLVLHQGALVANTSIDDLLKPAQQAVLVVFEEDITNFLSDPFWRLYTVKQEDKHTLVIKASDINLLKKNLMSFALTNSLNIQRLHTQEASLEEIFKLLTH
jgi:ABC-2 type transport system ATP-binding protein